MYIPGGNFWVIGVLTITAVVLGVALLFNQSGGDNTKTVTVAADTTATGITTATGTAPTPTGTTTSSTTTTTTTPGQTPGSPQASIGSCVVLWNQQNNRGNQTFLVNLFTRQPIRVHVGVTADVPPKCLITVVANNGDAYVFPEGGGGTYPYAQVPAATPAGPLPAAQKVSNAVEQTDGTLKAR
jgi:hypothetical protein